MQETNNWQIFSHKVLFSLKDARLATKDKLLATWYEQQWIYPV